MERIAIQVLTYKSADEFPQLLQSLARQTFKDWKLYVCDNSEIDEERERIKRVLFISGLPHLFLANGTNRGFTAHNQLFAEHRAPFILVLNDDAILESTYLEHTLERIESNQKIAAVTGLINRLDDPKTIDSAGLQYDCLGHIVDRFAGKSVQTIQNVFTTEPVFGVSCVAALFRRSAVESVSPEQTLFDSVFFMYKEDVDLAIRLKKAGHTAWLEPKAIAFHKRTIKDSAKGIISRIQEEKTRSIDLRIRMYVNQWRLYKYYFSWSLSIRDIVFTCWYELKRSASLFFFGSPTAFLQAWNEIQKINKPVIPAKAGIQDRIDSNFPACPACRQARRQARRWNDKPESKGVAGHVSPKIVIIYLTFATPNWKQDIDRAMKSIEKLSYPHDRIELICIESRSSKGERVQPWFEQTWFPKSGHTLPRITYLFRDEVIGFAGNNQIGYEKARELGCDYIYLLNEDAEFDQDAITFAINRAQQDPSIGQVQSFLLLGQDHDRVNSIGNAYHYLGFGYSNGYLWTRSRAEKYFDTQIKNNPDREIGYASGAGVLARTSAVEEIGALFDPKIFGYHEDTDLSFALRSRGYRIVVEPKSIVYHYYETEKTQMKKNYLIERNRWVIVFSYYRAWTLFLILPMFIVMEIALILFAMRSGWGEEKRRQIREAFTSDYWQWIKLRRHHIQTTHIIDDRELLKYAVGDILFQGEDVKNPILTYVGNPMLRAYGWIVRRLIY